MLNLLSLLLGLASWALGFAAAVKQDRRFLSFGSFTLCGAALVLQFFEISRRVAESDWSGLMDTVPTLAKVASILLFCTLLLNLLSLRKGK